MAAALALVLLVTVLAGFYPAFLLSGFRPASILRGHAPGGAGGSRLRRSLVVFQFTVSAVLIVCTIVVLNQMHFIQNKKLGFDREQVLVLHNASRLGDRADALKQEMLKYPQVAGATLSSFLPVPSARARLPIARADHPNPAQAFPVSFWRIDEDYLATLGMKIASGRNFSSRIAGDAQSAIINQAAASYFGFASPLGEKLVMLDESAMERGARATVSVTVVGVVEDFHFESLREIITPLVLLRRPSSGNLILRILPGQTAAVLQTLKAKWAGLAPGEPFEYSFLDDDFIKIYEAETRTGRIYTLFAIVAVLIGCLGLFGLAYFSAARRTKEIGIRKVLGAAVHEVAAMLIRDYVLLVGLANLVAWPVSYYLMHRWLQDFAYRAPLGLMPFVLSGLLGLAIALLTVGGQAIRAARANPVDSLRYE